MAQYSLTFDAVCEAAPGPKWQARWNRSWPAYQAWFQARGGDSGPSRSTCEAALKTHMPELLPIYGDLCKLAGNGDRAARFLSTWCPPKYLGGCSIASLERAGEVRLLRNYDLSPDLNEGLLLHSCWSGTRVMGMVEFIWGLSDGINDSGLSVALAYGGRSEVGPGFGITTILRYVLQTCTSVAEAVTVLRRVPSHMAYNIALADAQGETASVEVLPGGGAYRLKSAFATNHQKDKPTDRAAFTQTHQRHVFLERLFEQEALPEKLSQAFLQPPLFQNRYNDGFGTLFTAEYDPKRRNMTIYWQGETWEQNLEDFDEGQRIIEYDIEARTTVDYITDVLDRKAMSEQLAPVLSLKGRKALRDWALADETDWAKFGRVFTQ